MDPKAGQILDPKLKEAYDRVMGASIPHAAPKPPAPPPPSPQAHPQTGAPSSAHPETLKMPEQHVTPPPSTQHVTPPAPTGHAPTAPAQSTQPHATMSFSTAYVAPHPEKKTPVSGTLLVIAGVIFLLVYTLFWMKWFGMAIPFLP